MKYDHVGIPTTEERDWSAYLEDGKVHITDAAKDPFGVEWLKFDADSPMPAELKDRTHVAFFVDDLNAAIEGQKILIPPFKPFPDLTCAFIMHGSVPIELMQKG